MKGEGASILRPLLDEQIVQPPAWVEIKASLLANSGWSREIEADRDDPELPSAPCCRICLEGSRIPDELISPCMCKGTQQFVHRSCLDHWRSVKEGFAFTHCTTCKAQFHLYINFLKDDTWRTIKFRFFVAKNVFFMFLLVQMVISAIGALAYLMDIEGNFRNSFNDDFSKHPMPFYYCVGVVVILVGMGIYGILLQCSSVNRVSEVHRSGTCVCIPYDCCSRNSSAGEGEVLGSGTCVCVLRHCLGDSNSREGKVHGCGHDNVSSKEGFNVSVGMILFIVFVSQAIGGLIYAPFAVSLVIQYIWQKHYHIHSKRELAKEYMVEDLHGHYTPPMLDPEHEERLKYLKLW